MNTFFCLDSFLYGFFQAWFRSFDPIFFAVYFLQINYLRLNFRIFLEFFFRSFWRTANKKKSNNNIAITTIINNNSKSLIISKTIRFLLIKNILSLCARFFFNFSCFYVHVWKRALLVRQMNVFLFSFCFSLESN